MLRNTPAEWPSANGDISGSRHAALETAISPATVGRLESRFILQTDGANWATPVVTGDSLFLADAGGGLRRVDRDSGTTIWARRLSDLTGTPGAQARTSVVVTDRLVITGDRAAGRLIALDRATGDLRWTCLLDDHPGALVTGSPVLHDGVIFVGTSSLEGLKFMRDCGHPCSFIGHMCAVEAETGSLIWKTPTMPANDGATDSWSGGAVISVPAVDPVTDTVFFTTDHHYRIPAAVLDLMRSSLRGWDAGLLPDDFLASSLIALDRRTGAVKWTFLGTGLDAWEHVCGEHPDAGHPFPLHPVGQPAGPERIVPPAADFLNWSFAAGSPQVFDTVIGGRARHLVGAAHKSGVYWTFDAATGDHVWHSVVGPWSEPGGLTWGAAWDGQRLYLSLTNLERAPHRLSDGTLTDGGSWAALDPANGAILWQVAEPQRAPVYAAPAVANGVVFAGSMAATGDQMFALDAASGAILLRLPAGGSIGAHPAIAGGRVYWGAGFGMFGGSVTDKVHVLALPGDGAAGR
jgi:polyvinyl alcohol dehydrogenase (cytochrome)